MFDFDMKEEFMAIGNGKLGRGKAIVRMIALRLMEARAKHPEFAVDKYHTIGVIGEEFREFENAVMHESEIRQIDEAYDIIAPTIRFLNGEHGA